MEWWHWIVGGIALVLLELAIPSFFVFWFGLGALFVGLLLLVAPGLPLAGQILVWAIASAIMTVLWFRVFSRFRNKTGIGTAEGDIIGEIGLLVADTAPFKRGKVRFQRPVLGAEEWPCTSDAAIAIGTRVKLVSVEGSFLKVAPA
ncbi:MAG: NfeD family protein [Desulfobulbaceae bacterium]|jgi:membrane protein implicated in regulation of membrane protease activity|nr:NfeD family protein [Desulfobulbaceae bacterium]